MLVVRLNLSKLYNKILKGSPRKGTPFGFFHAIVPSPPLGFFLRFPFFLNLVALSHGFCLNLHLASLASAVFAVFLRWSIPFPNLLSFPSYSVMAIFLGTPPSGGFLRLRSHVQEEIEELVPYLRMKLCPRSLRAIPPETARTVSALFHVFETESIEDWRGGSSRCSLISYFRLLSIV